MTDGPPRPRQLLVLATSSASGGGMRDPGGAALWPATVQSGLAARFGEVELTLRRFYVHTGQPMEYLERELDRVQPDFIVLQCTVFQATQKTVAHRVEHILGKRAADWTEARVRSVDRNTRGRGPVRHRVNRAGHMFARKVIGTAPMVGYRQLVEGYLRAIDRVARVEDAEVAVMGTGHPSAAARRNNRQADAIVDRFNAEISAAARQKRFAFIDNAAITRSAGDPDAMFLDMLHKGQDWHDGVAALVLSAFLRD